MAKDIRIFLVRHGETHWNVRKITQGHRATRLTKKGVKQAEEMAKFFKNIPLAKIYCSPLFRTMQTVRRVLKYHSSSKLVKWPEFVEIKGGVLEGLSRKKQHELFPELKELPRTSKRLNWRPPEGESIRDVFQRSVKGFDKMIKLHKPGDNILVITHGGVLRCLLLNLQGKKLNEIKMKTPLPNCGIIEVLWNKKAKKIRHVK